MKFLTVFVLIGTIGAALGGGSSLCEPFLSNFRAFDQVMLTLLTNIQQYSLSSSTSAPFLAPSYASALKCEANNSIVLAASAISRLSGVDPSVIINILNGTASQPFETPLDCIATDLIYLRDQILNIKNNVVPSVAALRQIPQGSLNNCFDVFARLSSFIPTLLSLTAAKAPEIASETALFTSIGMADLYQQFLNSICLWDNVEAAFGSMLNADASPIISYVNGQSSTLPFPFSCIQSLIDFLNGNLLQQLRGIFSGTSTSLSLPNGF